MNTSILELRHFYTLIALVESGSLTQAAARVHLTQSALSHQIKQLEDQYGVTLFERKTQPLRLTASGTRLHALALSVIALIDQGERDLARISQGGVGRLRIAVECHSCFDWLMPSMDSFRSHWPEVELDLVAGFHIEPVRLLLDNEADVVIVSEPRARKDISFHPLFRFEIVTLIANQHRFLDKPYLNPQDFAKEILITYPVPDEMLDLVRKILKPRGIRPKRRTAELTAAILQLVASGRGIAALPNWSVQTYIERGYVLAKPIGKKGFWGELYAATTRSAESLAYVQDFLKTVRATSFSTLKGILPHTPT